MSRWPPDARGRLEQAALELFDDRGFDRTTVDDIASRAGVTKRTFFRHFTDKREVLFAGGEAFQEAFLDGLAAAPASATPLEVVDTTLQAVAAFFPSERRAFARRRQALIASSAELQERELVKLSWIASAFAEDLRRRGVTEPAASITAETALAIFRTGFERWVTPREKRDLGDLMREGVEALRAVAAGS